MYRYRSCTPKSAAELLAESAKQGPVAPLCWTERTLRLAPAEGDGTRAVRVGQVADVSVVGQGTVVPAVSAARAKTATPPEATKAATPAP